MAGKNQHVVPTPDGNWGVRGEGNSKITKETSTQDQAIEIAREIARNQGSEVVIHKRDGTIRDKDSYGKDPCPPKDKKH
jgi:diacylglycerol kinase family enzyme